MLIKDFLIATRLNHKTANSTISVSLSFKLKQDETKLSFNYQPDKFKIEQKSVVEYLTKLTNSEDFDLENISARITEDLYDIAVPKTISLTLSQTIDNIETSITTTKSQPQAKTKK